MYVFLDHQIASLLKIRFLDEEVTNSQFSQKVRFWVEILGLYLNWNYRK